MKRRLPAVLLLAVCLLLLSAIPTFSAKVVRDSEGDTMNVLHDDALEIIYLYGIDAPENSQPFGAEAEKFLSGLASGKNVTVRPKSKDENGDIIAEVVAPDGRLLNREVGKNGFAWWTRKRRRRTKRWSACRRKPIRAVP